MNTKRLDLLDYARLGAALAVMAFHYLYNGIVGGKISSLTHGPLATVASYGYLGVEFFFIISGYVIFYTAKDKTPGEFAVSRAVRLYPAFWVAVLFTASFAAFLGGEKMAVSGWQVLANLTMIPELFGARPVDGVYWTLLLELKFYALVLGLLLLGLRRHLEPLFLAWPVLMLAALLVGKPHLPYLGGYYAFFAAGAIFAMIRDRITLLALASLSTSFFVAVSYSMGNVTVQSPMIVASIIAAQFAFFFALNTPRGLSMSLPKSKLAGGLTYPLYLVHAHVGYMLLSRFATNANKLLVYPLVIAFVLGVAYLIHKYVETAPARVWRQLFSWSIGKPLDRVFRAA